MAACSSTRSDIVENCCFFGRITGDAAREILYKETSGAEGAWLIRESISSPGHYVLSVILDGEVQHILIHAHAQEDAVYSLTISDDAPVFHGLDTLIQHYCEHPLKPSHSDHTQEVLYATPQDDASTHHAGVTDSALQSTTPPYILRQACYQDPLPPHTKLHGSMNLLHRAVQQENLVVVKELLKSGYRKVDARTPEGLTALHLACLSSTEDIVKELLAAGAWVKVRDAEGLSPLHYVCRLNKPSLVSILITHDPSAITWRAGSNAEVALHEAAASRCLPCVEVLLQHGAPSCPRNKEQQTPADLALLHHATAIHTMLEHHRPPAPKFASSSYTHGTLSRTQAHQLLASAQQLQDSQGKGAVFLVRSSERTTRRVLSLGHNNLSSHYVISEKSGKFYIDDGPLFDSIENLVDHYRRLQDGLPALLTTPLSPVNNNTRRPLSGIQSSTSSDRVANWTWRHTELSPGDVAETRRLISPESSREDLTNSAVTWGSSTCNGVTARDQLSLALDKISVRPSPVLSPTPQSTPSSPSTSALTVLENKTGATTPTLDGNRTSEICGRIDINSLSVGETLGSGEFGSVLRGVWVSPAGDQMPVAVKTLHATSDCDNKELFLQEAKLMMNLNHPYIIKLLGVCDGPPVAMVQELAPMGALLDYLLDNPHKVNYKFHLKLWPAQVALGMQYLEQKRFVHRDLACRNLLLSTTTLVKITDFGLSRAMGQNSDYYRASKGGKWPLKWNAPESINYGRFTHSSDVWSYGVTLWEMYTYGDQPYGDLPGYKVVSLLEKGERLPQPSACSSAVYGVMLSCWHLDPNKRPNFSKLAQHFSTGPDYVDVKPYLKTKG